MSIAGPQSHGPGAPGGFFRGDDQARIQQAVFAAGQRLLAVAQALDEMVQELDSKHHTDIESETVRFAEYKFEPSPEKVLEMLLPRLTEMQVYQAILEATASEHSARMFAMRNASDNAAEFIADLTLTYNQLRQASITAELAEISAGMAALS